MIEVHISLSYWGEALTSATYLINRVPFNTIAFKTSSQDLVQGVVSLATPNLPLYVFGYVAFIHLHKHQHNKLQPRALRCVFIIYATHQKGYRCYHPLVFHEDSIYFSKSELQKEYRKEVQTLDYNVHISIEVPPNDQDMSTLDTSMNLNRYRDTSDDNNSQTGNQDVGIVDANGINLEASDDDLQTKLIY